MKLLSGWYCWWFRNPAPPGMYKTLQIMHKLSTLYLLGISSINSRDSDNWVCSSHVNPESFAFVSEWFAWRNPQDEPKGRRLIGHEGGGLLRKSWRKQKITHLLSGSLAIPGRFPKWLSSSTIGFDTLKLKKMGWKPSKVSSHGLALH